MGVLFHCGFNLHCPRALVGRASHHVPICYLCLPLVTCLQITCPFFNWTACLTGFVLELEVLVRCPLGEHLLLVCGLSLFR